MIRRIGISLLSGTFFGAGLAISGMLDPARVRAFLDVAGAWDPTLAFVMVGAILPMVIAWYVLRRSTAPLADDRFHIPGTSVIDAQLLIGGVLFGVGWGLVGFCPGPAIAALALRPFPALMFVLAMAIGAALYRFGSGASTSATLHTGEPAKIFSPEA